MEYNLYEIGDRIRTHRKDIGMKQKPFAEDVLHISRNTLSKIENGEEKDGRPQLTFDLLLKFSKFFNCDIGYLLGEYDEKKKETHEICSATGLSENALNKILKEKDHCCIKQFNQIIEDKDFWNIVDFFCIYRNTAKTISEHNAEYSKLYWESVKDKNNEKTQKKCETLETSLELAKYEYEMNRFKCKLFFEKIVDKFLPKV